MKGDLRDPGGPTGSIEQSAMGARCKGQPEYRGEPRSGVGPARSTEEALEGNEGAKGRGWREGNLLERAEVGTQSRVALPPNLQRVSEAARRNRQARFTALLHHVDVAALERAFPAVKAERERGSRQTVALRAEPAEELAGPLSTSYPALVRFCGLGLVSSG